ncbi:MAG: GGDEF domain-containing protein [Clostridia bacterium]|nr:GGDEF domain-containing protein [Clostridia bacterium]
MDKNRITKLAFVIVVVCFVLSTFVSLWSLRGMARHNMQDLSKVLAAGIYDSIGGELAEPIVAARAMASDTLFIELLRNEARYDEEEIVKKIGEYLSGIKNGLGYESAFAVSEASRRYYSFNGLHKQIDPEGSAYDHWYSLFLEKGKPYDLDVDRDEILSDAWTVFVNARVEDTDGTLLGVCGVGVHMMGSQQMFYALEDEYKVKLSLIDESGLVQVDTDERSIESVNLNSVAFNRQPNGEYIYTRLDGDKAVVTKYLEKLGWYLVVQSDGEIERGEFLNVIGLNVALCLLVLVILLAAIRIIVLRTRALANASFRDQMTHLLNRRAFEEEKERLSMTALAEDFIYVTADLNGLKTANDGMGHAAGDEMIVGAAACLKKSYGKYGKVFRIGGDEFAAMLTINEEKFAALKADFEKTVSEWSGDKVRSLSISCGFAASKEFPSENISELIRISDERMYAEKEAYYRRKGIDRRRT